MRLLTENDYRILVRILDEGSMSKTSGITISILKPLVNLSYTKINVALKTLVEYGFVELGISKGRERTFYITQKGVMELNSITQNVVNIKRSEINE